MSDGISRGRDRPELRNRPASTWRAITRNEGHASPRGDAHVLGAWVFLTLGRRSEFHCKSNGFYGISKKESRKAKREIRKEEEVRTGGKCRCKGRKSGANFRFAEIENGALEMRMLLRNRRIRFLKKMMQIPPIWKF